VNNLTGVQKRAFFDLIKTFNIIERRVLIWRHIHTDVTYHDLWSLYYAPALRLGLSKTRARVLRRIGSVFGCSIGEMLTTETKVLLRMRHPVRSAKLKRILDSTPF
jgi:hypothetical protein